MLGKLIRHIIITHEMKSAHTADLEIICIPFTYNGYGYRGWWACLYGAGPPVRRIGII